MSTHAIQQLLETMARLRRDCPWDKAQTPQSLTRYAIEEAYEVEAAVVSGDIAHIKEELGDLLLQVVFQACMYEEAGQFDFEAIVTTLTEKLIRRHPHVFANTKTTVSNAADVDQIWQQVKQAEALSAGKPKSLLSQVKHGSALHQSQSLQKTAARIGFDWADVAGARDKLNEELAELDHAINTGDTAQITDELGDCLFSLVNVARKLNIDSESALLGTTHKFRRRFGYIETQLAVQGMPIESATLATMDALWNEAKTLT